MSFLARNEERSPSSVRLCLVHVDSIGSEEELDDVRVSVVAVVLVLVFCVSPSDQGESDAVLPVFT